MLAQGRPRFSYHFRFAVAEPMQAISGRPSPFKSAMAQAAAAHAVVQHRFGPVRAFGVLRVVHVHAFAAIAGDHFVRAVAVQIGGENGVAVGQRIVDHVPLPHAAAFPVDGDLVAVPRLDGRQKPPLAQLAHGHVARTAFGPRRGVALAISVRLQRPSFPSL